VLTAIAVGRLEGKSPLCRRSYNTVIMVMCGFQLSKNCINTVTPELKAGHWPLVLKDLKSLISSEKG
jgi:hypothetical protein